MRPLTRVAAIAAALSASLLACRPLDGEAEAPTGSNEADHTAGEPVHGGYAWQWANETKAEYVAADNAAHRARGLATRKFLRLDHPVAVRLTFWADRIDAALREAQPDALEFVPHPRIILVDDPRAGGFVTPVPIAWAVPGRLASGRRAPSGDATDALGERSEYFLRSNGRIVAPLLPSLLRPHTDASVRELVKFFGGGFAECRMSIDEEGRLSFGRGCESSFASNDGVSERVGFSATSTFIGVGAQHLVHTNDEDKAVALVAHELGHFYRSHVNMPSDVLNYFYDLDGAAHAHRPPLDEAHRAETDAIREKLRTLNRDFIPENELMSDKHLGFYTTEQEADELGLELMTKVGVSPDVAIDNAFQLMKLYPGSDDRSALDYEACAKLRDAGWKDASGRRAAVPIGDIADPHHSLCFRAANLAREIAAHVYEVADRPEPPGGSFTSLLDGLAKEIAE